MTCIYGLFDPRTGQCRYVGKTDRSADERLKQHIGDARRRIGQFNVPRFTWINALLAEGLAPTARVLESVVPPADWREAERRHIRLLREAGVSLLNCTDGGDGVEGWRASPETRARMSAAAKAIATDELCARRAEASRRACESPDVRARLSASLKATYANPEVRARLGVAIKRALSDPAVRERRSAALKGRTFSPEWRAKISASKIGIKASEEAKAKMSLARKGRKH